MTKKVVDALQETEPFIPYADPDEAPDYLKDLLGPYIKRMGFLPNALKLYMHRPEIAELLWQMNNRVMRDSSSTLDQKLKRQFGALISKLNGCRYCTTHNSNSLQNPSGQDIEGWDYSDEELNELLSGDWVPDNDFERACYDFVWEASVDPANVSDKTYEALQENLTPAQIIELAAVVGFWKLYNTIHLSLKVPLEKNLNYISEKIQL